MTAQRVKSWRVRKSGDAVLVLADGTEVLLTRAKVGQICHISKIVGKIAKAGRK